MCDRRGRVEHEAGGRKCRAELWRVARSHNCWSQLGLRRHKNVRMQVLMADLSCKATVIEGDDCLAIAAAGEMQSIGPVESALQTLHGLLQSRVLLCRHAGLVQQ